jgi:hypothetical protein
MGFGAQRLDHYATPCPIWYFVAWQIYENLRSVFVQNVVRREWRQSEYLRFPLIARSE